MTPSPTPLHKWFSTALSALTTVIEASTPRSPPLLKVQTLVDPSASSLREEFTCTTHSANKLQIPKAFLTTRQSKVGYFKALKELKLPTRPTSSPKPP